LSGLDPLQGSAVNVCLFCQLLLSEFGGISQPIDVPANQNVYLNRSIHGVSMSREKKNEGGSICRFFLVLFLMNSYPSM